jgi:capsular exopolysaccharide synthesis family protein
MSTLTTNAVLDEIRRLHDNEASGILSLMGDNGQRVDVHFREGMIEAAYSNLSGRRLGDYLLKDGYASAGDLDAVEPIARRQKIFLGEAVVRKGLLNQVDVEVAVRRQAVELLDYVFKNGFAIASFKSSLRSYYAPARIGFKQVLLELCRSNAAPVETGSNVRIALSDGIDLSLFHWSPQELYVLSELQYPNTFDGLLKATGLQQASLKTILGVLDGLGVIKIQDSLESMDAAVQSGVLVRTGEFPFEHLIPVIDNALLHEKLEVAKNESSFTSEQFKNLKVQLNEANSANPLKVLTISSPDAQDGKSLVGVNLAFSFAMDVGRRVIIVDCDLRNPSMGDYLGVPSQPGLLQYLANGHMSPYCYVRRVQNLYFLTSGGIAQNPVEILSMNKMKQLIEHLRKHFDTIILDSPPYCPISDARIVTGLSDGLIMVVRRGKTSCTSTDRAFKAVDRNKLLGVVFNHVQPKLFHTYYNFGYYDYGRNRKVYTNAAKIRNTPKNYLES